MTATRSPSRLGSPSWRDCQEPKTSSISPSPSRQQLDEKIQPVSFQPPVNQVSKANGTRGSTNSLNADTPITYLYLTFNTPVPPPTTTVTPLGPQDPGQETSHPPPPPQPSLARYIDPKKWPGYRKLYHLVFCCVSTFLTAYCAGSFSPPAMIMAEYFGVSRTAVLCGITTFCMGFALAPMMLAPFSEINGRYPVFAVSGVIFVAFQVVCAVTPNLGGMLVARFLVGVGGSVFSTMIGGVIADLWDANGRNTPMAVYSGSVLAGTGVGPLVSSVLTYRLDGQGDKWRWVFWHQVIMGGVLMALLVFLFKESRGSVVLSRRAGALNKWYEECEAAGYYGVWMRESADGELGTGNSSGEEDDGDETQADMSPDEEKAIGKDLAATAPLQRSGTVTNTKLVRLRWRVKADEDRSSLGKMISISVARPFHMLFTEPVVFFFSLWVSFAWAVLYLTFASIPYVFSVTYGWNVEKCGYAFVAMIVGSVLATIIGVWQEELLKNPRWRAAPDHWADTEREDSDDPAAAAAGTPRRSDRFYAFLRAHFPVEAPESRLYFTCLTATFLPLGLFLFGFTTPQPWPAPGTSPWIAPAAAVCLATMGILAVYLATFNYLADVYHLYASSALAAQSCCRNALGGVFPLVTLPLFRNLGSAGAGGLLGGVAATLTLVPWVLVFFGTRIRARSRFAAVLEKEA